MLSPAAIDWANSRSKCFAMSNTLVDVHSQPYVAAPPLKSAALLQVALRIAQTLLDLLVVLIRSVPLWFELLVEIFAPPKPKNVGGQTALVTGGANGIGKAIATELAREGCNVVLVDLDEVNGERVAVELRRYNVKTVAYKVCYLLWI